MMATKWWKPGRSRASADESNFEMEWTKSAESLVVKVKTSSTTSSDLLPPPNKQTRKWNHSQQSFASIGIPGQFRQSVEPPRIATVNPKLEFEKDRNFWPRHLDRTGFEIGKAKTANADPRAMSNPNAKQVQVSSSQNYNFQKTASNDNEVTRQANPNKFETPDVFKGRPAEIESKQRRADESSNLKDKLSEIEEEVFERKKAAMNNQRHDSVSLERETKLDNFLRERDMWKKYRHEKDTELFNLKQAREEMKRIGAVHEDLVMIDNAKKQDEIKSQIRIVDEALVKVDFLLSAFEQVPDRSSQVLPRQNDRVSSTSWSQSETEVSNSGPKEVPPKPDFIPLTKPLIEPKDPFPMKLRLWPKKEPNELQRNSGYEDVSDEQIQSESTGSLTLSSLSSQPLTLSSLSSQKWEPNRDPELEDVSDIEDKTLQCNTQPIAPTSQQRAKSPQDPTTEEDLAKARREIARLHEIIRSLRYKNHHLESCLNSKMSDEERFSNEMKQSDKFRNTIGLSPIPIKLDTLNPAGTRGRNITIPGERDRSSSYDTSVINRSSRGTDPDRSFEYERSRSPWDRHERDWTNSGQRPNLIDRATKVYKFAEPHKRFRDSELNKSENREGSHDSARTNNDSSSSATVKPDPEINSSCRRSHHQPEQFDEYQRHTDGTMKGSRARNESGNDEWLIVRREDRTRSVDPVKGEDRQRSDRRFQFQEVDKKSNNDDRQKIDEHRKIDSRHQRKTDNEFRKTNNTSTKNTIDPKSPARESDRKINQKSRSARERSRHRSDPRRNRRRRSPTTSNSSSSSSSTSSTSTSTSSGSDKICIDDWAPKKKVLLNNDASLLFLKEKVRKRQDEVKKEEEEIAKNKIRQEEEEEKRKEEAKTASEPTPKEEPKPMQRKPIAMKWASAPQKARFGMRVRMAPIVGKMPQKVSKKPPAVPTTSKEAVTEPQLKTANFTGAACQQTKETHTAHQLGQLIASANTLPLRDPQSSTTSTQSFQGTNYKSPNAPEIWQNLQSVSTAEEVPVNKPIESWPPTKTAKSRWSTNYETDERSYQQQPSITPKSSGFIPLDLPQWAFYQSASSYNFAYTDQASQSSVWGESCYYPQVLTSEKIDTQPLQPSKYGSGTLNSGQNYRSTSFVPTKPSSSHPQSDKENAKSGCLLVDPMYSDSDTENLTLSDMEEEVKDKTPANQWARKRVLEKYDFGELDMLAIDPSDLAEFGQ